MGFFSVGGFSATVDFSVGFFSALGAIGNFLVPFLGKQTETLRRRIWEDFGNLWDTPLEIFLFLFSKKIINGSISKCVCVYLIHSMEFFDHLSVGNCLLISLSSSTTSRLTYAWTDSCLVIPPPTSKKPRAIIEFYQKA
ncbi:hypothetical protein ACFX2I_035916 [Malus domestica]